MALPLINGNSYSWSEIVFSLFDVPIAGVTAITYIEAMEKTNNPGAGNRAVSRGRGFIDANGSIDISMNDVEAIRDVAPDGSLVKLPMFNIVVSFLNAGTVRRHPRKYRPPASWPPHGLALRRCRYHP